MALRFEWDARKALISATKHGVSFEEARTVFGDLLSPTVADQKHENGEFRFAIVGRTAAGRLVAVSHVERDDTIRIVSARLADRREKRVYEEGQDDRP